MSKYMPRVLEERVGARIGREYAKFVLSLAAQERGPAGPLKGHIGRVPVAECLEHFGVTEYYWVSNPALVRIEQEARKTATSMLQQAVADGTVSLDVLRKTLNK